MIEQGRIILKIHKNTLANNLKKIYSLGIEYKNIIAVVKANAYGLGLEYMVNLLSQLGIKRFAVAYLEEALKIQKYVQDIYILGGFIEEEVESAIRHKFILSINSLKDAILVDKYAQALNIQARISLVVDSGMGRVGFLPKNLLKDIKLINGLKNLDIRGVYSHFARLSSPYDENFSMVQMKKMQFLYEQLLENDFSFQEYHIARSYCLSLLPKSFNFPFNLCRLGIALYGFDSFLKDKLGLFSIAQLQAKVLTIRLLPKGWNVGYGEYILEEDSLIATLSIGYADLIIGQWSKNKKSYVLFRGKSCPIIHTSMDYTIICIPKDIGMNIGDYVTILGKDGQKEITVSELADCQSVVNYNIFCSLGERCQRIIIE